MISIAVSAIKPDPQTLTFALEGKKIDIGPEAKIAGMCEVELTLYKFQNKIFIRGALKADLEMECARCLDVFRIKKALPVEWVAVPESNVKLAALVQGSENDPALITYSQDHLELTEAIQNAVFVSVPMKPLCGAECEGLCPMCGQKISNATCSCKRS
jgi:uncharacterized protein